jgi:arylsulfatase A-like enzyme
MVCWGLVIWMMVIVPVLVLLQIDALLIYRTTRQIVRDIALLLALCAIPATSLALAGRSMHWILGRLGRPQEGVTTAWSAVVLPTACLALWQLARATGVLIRPVNEFHVSLGPTLRGLAAAVIVLLVGGLWWRLGGGRLIKTLLPPVLSLRTPALLAWAVATSFLIFDAHPVLRELAGPPAPLTEPLARGERRPDVLLITLDSLAAVDAQVCGNGPTTMPQLRALAERATCFERHIASSNFTTPTTSTLETGTLPWTHLAGQVGAQVIEHLQGHTLASGLRQAGYITYSVNANLLASPRHHGTYRAYVKEELSHSTSLVNKFEALTSILADSVAPQLLSGLFPPELDFLLLDEDTPVAPQWSYDRALALVRSSPHGTPMFLWVHTLPPHAPYLPPRTTKYRLLPRGELENFHQFRTGNTPYAPHEQGWIDKHRMRYRETIMGADESLGEFLGALERAGRLDNALVVVTADHGESFEKSLLGHAGPLLHDALIRVPLVVKLPGQRQGYVIKGTVSQADIAPTILDIVGAAALTSAEGRSLRDALGGQEPSSRPAFSMAMERQSRFRPLQKGHFAMQDDHYKAVLHPAEGRIELFDIAADPAESKDIASSEVLVAQRMKSAIETRLQVAESFRKRSAVASP